MKIKLIIISLFVFILLLSCTIEDDEKNEKKARVGDTIKMLMDINPGPSSSHVEYFIVFNEKLFFKADDGINGSE